AARGPLLPLPELRPGAGPGLAPNPRLDFGFPARPQQGRPRQDGGVRHHPGLRLRRTAIPNPDRPRPGPRRTPPAVARARAAAAHHRPGAALAGIAGALHAQAAAGPGAGAATGSRAGAEPVNPTPTVTGVARAGEAPPAPGAMSPLSWSSRTASRTGGGRAARRLRPFRRAFRRPAASPR